jgi:signal transduction histidine kinase
MGSLKNRLSWGLMLSLIALLTLQWVVVTYAIGRLTEAQLIERLQREGESLLASVQFDMAGQLQIDPQRMGSVYHRPFSGHYYVALANGQQKISRSLWDFELNVKALALGQQAQLRLGGPGQQPLLVVAHGYQKQGQAITIAIAEDLTPLQSGIGRFQLLYAVISALGLLFLLLIQRLIVLNALQPLRGVQENMVRLGRGESDHVEVQGPEEIRPLIEELNRLLAGMDRKTKRSREALGNLAHALKTRLTLLNQIAEKKEIKKLPELQSSIYASTEAIGKIIERELKRARLLGDIRPGRQVDLRTEIADLVNTLRQLYVAKHVNITWEVVGNTKFIGDKEDLLELLGNLLDNACKWCRSRVSLTVTGERVVTFIIEDDGPGRLATELDTLTRRGFRVDESKPGSGLGLAIVNDIVESYSGALTFGRSAALGGLRVEAKFDQEKSVN